MIIYAEYKEIGRLIIMVWCLPGFEYHFMNDENCKHLFGKLYWRNKI